MRGGSAGLAVRDPENQGGACESLNGPIALAINILILGFSLSFFLGGGDFFK